MRAVSRGERPKPKAHAKYLCWLEGEEPRPVTAAGPYEAAVTHAEERDGNGGEWAAERTVYVRGPTGGAVAYTVSSRRVAFYEAKRSKE